jgi:hypothetical protein
VPWSRDGIEEANDELFNLALQRINPTTGLIEDQELCSNASFRKESDNFIGDMLMTSSLARVEHPYPSHRPETTMDAGGRIGSVDSFDLLYLPPPGKGIDTGPAAILAAEMYCRERRAMLIVDPRAEWETAEEALRGVRELGYASPNMLGYYPRMRERGSDDIARPVGGAIAGLLCKLDRTYGPWQDVDQQGLGLQRQLVPALDVNNEDTRLLGRMGLNVISGGRSGRARLRGSVTMGRGREAHRKSAQLPVRRFCLQVINTIAAAARWAVFESDDLSVGERICAQVRTYY